MSAGPFAPMTSPPRKKRTTRLPPVKAGQMYRAKARRGWSYVKVLRVHPAIPCVTVRKVNADGSKVYGRYPQGHTLQGMRRGDPFTVYMTWVEGQLQLSSSYELCE